NCGSSHGAAIYVTHPRRLFRRERVSDFRGCFDLPRIALPEENGGGRIADQERAGDGAEDRLFAAGEALRHRVARPLHARDERGIAELRNAAAKVAGGKLVRLIVFAEEESVFERGKERDAEVVTVDV